MAVTEVANRWMFMKLTQWRVGVTSATYSWAGEGRLGNAGFMRNPDPFVELRIPKGTTNILQEINTGKKGEGFIEVIDWNTIKQLLYTIDVDNATGGTQTAILTGNSRTTIDYFVIAGVPIQIVNSTDARTTPTAAYSFTNTLIRDVEYAMERPNNPIIVRFYFDSVTETVA